MISYQTTRALLPGMRQALLVLTALAWWLPTWPLFGAFIVTAAFVIMLDVLTR